MIDIQPFLDNPQVLTTKSIEIQLAVVNNPATPRELLELLAASDNPEVAISAQNHVNWAGELTEDCHFEAEKLLRNSNLGQNDVASATLRERLAAELLKFAPVPEWFLSEWVPAERLLAGLRHDYWPRRWQVQFLERLAREDFLEARLLVAESPDTPVSILEELAGDLELPVRLAVKYNPNCPTETVEIVESQQAIASNWETDAQQLAELAESRWSWVRLRVAQNPSAPLEVLEKFAEAERYLIRLAVARNPSTPTATLEKLIKNDRAYLGRDRAIGADSNSIMLWLARHPNASERMLLELLPHYREAIAKRTDLPVSVIEKLMERSDRQYSLLQQQNLTPALLERLLEGAGKYQRAEIAKHPQTTASILERLAEDSEAKVRLAVAQNPNTPEELRVRLLEELAAGSDEQAKKAIADNRTQERSEVLEPLTVYRTELEADEREQERQGHKLMAKRTESPYSLAEVQKSGNDSARIYAARNSQTPVSVLERLAKDPVEGVRLELAKNPSLPLHSRLELTDDPSDRVRMELARERYRQQVPPEVLERLAADSSERVRELVAQNSETPSSVLDKLAGDDAPQVRLAVLNNLNTPASGLREIARNNPKLKEKMLWRKPSGNEESVREALRMQHRFLVELIEEFASSADNSIRYKISGHPKTPISILERLAFDDYKLVRLGVAQNPNTPPQTLIQMASRDRVTTASGCAHTVSHAIAERSDAPAEALDFIARQPVDWIRGMALKHPHTAAETLARSAASESNEWLLSLLAKHPNLSDEVALQVYRRENEVVRQSLASNSRLGASILEAIASDRAASVRKQVGANSNAPVNLLEMLASDSAPEVRAAVAANAHTPEQILERLAGDEKIEVRRAVAKNPATPTSILESLRDLLPPPIKPKLSPTLQGLGRIYDPETDDLPSLLSEYARCCIRNASRTSVAFVRFVALMHPLTPAEALQAGSESLWWWERYAVAANPATPAGN